MKQEKNKNNIAKIVFTSLFAALVCVATMAIKIPTSTNGYLHLGDALVLLSGWLLGPLYGTFAAAIGSMFADIFSSYIAYAPATFIIKGVVAALAYFLAHMIGRVTKKHPVIAYVMSGIIAELVMVFGYYIFEATVCGFGFIGAAVGIFGNMMQGIAGIVIGTFLVIILQKTQVAMHLIEKHGFIRKD